MFGKIIGAIFVIAVLIRLRYVLDYVTVFIASYILSHSYLVKSTTHLSKFSIFIASLIIAFLLVAIYDFIINRAWNYSKIVYSIILGITSLFSAILTTLFITYLALPGIYAMFLKGIEPKITTESYGLFSGILMVSKNKSINILVYIITLLALSVVFYIIKNQYQNKKNTFSPWGMSKKRRDEKTYTREKFEEEFYNAEENNSNNYNKTSQQINYNISSKNNDPKGYYKILGIDHNATLEEIKISYRNLLLKYHPDKNNNSNNSTNITKLINEAYSVLSDENKRNEYDRFGETL